MHLGSSIKLGNYIYVYPGQNYRENGEEKSMRVQRIELSSKEDIVEIAMIGEHDTTYWNPILVRTSSDVCN